MGRRGLRRKVGRWLPQPCESKRDTKRAAPETPARPAFLAHAAPLRIEGEYFSREVNEQNRTPEASTLLRRCFLRFRRSFPAVLTPKSMDASGVQNRSFTSREKYSPSFSHMKKSAAATQNGACAWRRPRRERSLSPLLSTARRPCSGGTRGCGQRPCRGRRAARSSSRRRRSAPGTNARWRARRPRRTRARRAP